MTGERMRRTPTRLWVATIVALAIVIAAFIVNARELAAAFLAAYAAIVSVVLATLALVLIAHLTTATWFRPFRAPAHFVIASLPALAALGIVLLLALPTLYPWMQSGASPRGYLNAPFFVVRWVIYWAAWIAIARIFGTTHRARRVASVGLIVLGVTMTFAAFDWLMSLTPDWASTAYGLYWFAGGAVGALALLALLTTVGAADYAWQPPSTDDVHALGKLMLTFVLFWVYIGFSQYIVIWSGDIPREVTWFVPRTHGGWGIVAGVLVLCNFALPFLLLLLEPVKRSRVMLASIGALLLALHYVDTLWMVMPGLVPVRWWTALVAIAVFFLCVTAVSWSVSSRYLARLRAPTRRVPAPT